MRRFDIAPLITLALAALSLQACGANDSGSVQLGPLDAGASNDTMPIDAGPKDPSDAAVEADAAPPEEEDASHSDLTEAVTVSIDDPSGPAATNSTIQLSVSVTGEPASVDLVAAFDGEEIVIAADLATPYTFTWDTSSLPEGTYDVVARARMDYDLFEQSEARAVRVDRTAPTVAGQTPEAGSTRAATSLGVFIRFDEPIDPDSVTRGAATVTLDGRPYDAYVRATEDDTIQVAYGSPFDPAMSFAAFDEVSVSLSASILDRAGNPLGPYQAAWIYPAFGELSSGPLTSLNGSSVSATPHDDGAAAAATDCVQIQSRTCTDHDLLVYTSDADTLTPLGDAASRHPGRRILSHDVASLDGVVFVAYSVDSSTSVTSSSGDVYLSTWSRGAWDHGEYPVESDRSRNATSPTLLATEDEVFMAWVEREDTANGRAAKVYVSGSQSGVIAGAQPFALSGASGSVDGVALSHYQGRLVLGVSLDGVLELVTHDGADWTPLPNLQPTQGARLIGIVDGAALVYDYAPPRARLIPLDGALPVWTLPGVEPLALTPTDIIARTAAGEHVVYQGRPPTPSFGGATFADDPADVAAVLTRHGALQVFTLEHTSPPTLHVLTPNRP